MDDSRVLARLDRIDALDRGGARPGELLTELRGLLRDAEEIARSQNGVRGEAQHCGEEVVGRRRTALARDIIGM